MTAVSIAALLFGVVPVHDWFDQRSTTVELQSELNEVKELNRTYRDRIDALNTDQEIERRARSLYNLVLPNEEAYAVSPLPSLGYRLPGIWPFDFKNETN